MFLYLIVFLTKQVLLDHSTANGMVKVSVLLKSLDGKRAVDLLEISVSIK